MKKILLATMLMLVSTIAFAEDKPQPGVINVSGAGEVSAKPDMAVINAGVTTENESAKACYAANSEIMNKVYAELKAMGITDNDIKTAAFNLNPRIVYPNKPGERERITGYTLAHIFNVNIQDVKKTGEVIDKLAKAGATNINNVQFRLKNDEEYLSFARGNAVKAARKKADELAKGAGVALGKIVSISEDNARPVYPVYNEMRMMKAAAAPAPVMEGELNISVSVQMTYEIKQ